MIDKVAEGEYDAHAALQYSESWSRLSDKQKGIKGQLIRADIVDAFGKIVGVKEIFA